MNIFAGKRLVIFGCGYVGQAMATEAMGRGLRVTALTRNAAKAILLRQQGIETVVADLATTDWHDAIPARPEFVLNAVSSGGGGLEGYQRSYVDGLRSIKEWARKSRALGTIVYTSSTSVYPQGGGARIDEAARTDTPETSERARTLVAAEDQLADLPCERWFVLRLAGIYGPGRHHFIDQVRSGEASGRGEHHLNLIHRDDIVAAIMSCFSAPPGVANEIFNVVDDGPARKAEIVSWVAAKLGVAVPQFTGEPVAGRRAVTPDRVIANAKIKKAVGWVPRYSTFREGCASLLSR
jgi:nucleoside-diphosphate-sugar epimerase